MLEKPIRYYLVFAMLVSMLVSCSSTGSTDQAPGAVETYLKALQKKEENLMITQSCAEWESEAKVEFNSFAAVEIELEGPDCQVSGEDGQTILVTCRGRIIAGYGDEDLIIELDKRTYQVVEEAGEWRVCGYR